MQRPDTIHPLREPVYQWRPRTHGTCIFEDLSLNLPLEASLAGMTLTYELPPFSGDPVYLKDRDGNILHEWEYTPSLSQVREVSLTYLR